MQLSSGRGLGADVITFGPDELQLGAGPTLTVVDALGLDGRPTRAIADLATLTEEFGSLDGRHVLAVGEGNTSGAALALAAALTPGLRLTLRCPKGYQVPDRILDLAAQLSGGGAQVAQVTHPDEVEDGPVDAVYTSRRQTMGVSEADPVRLTAFEGFRIDSVFLDRFSGPQTVLLHDLSAVRGQEVTDSVLGRKPIMTGFRQGHDIRS